MILEKLTTSRKTNKQRFNSVRLAEQNRIPTRGKYFNPRITFDGPHWWISVGAECDENTEIPTRNGIGIDIGIKDLAICSDGKTYGNINKTVKVKKLKRDMRRLQRRISEKYSKNKKGECYCKTGNIIKSKKKLLKIIHRLKNIRHSYLHSVTYPEFPTFS